MSTDYSPGLEGIIAGETSVSTVADGLRYRGYPVGQLVEHATFEEVAYLMLYKEMPTASELQEFHTRVAMSRRLPEVLRAYFESVPKWTPPLDVLRTAVSALAHWDQDANDNSTEANIRKAERLIGQIPVAIADHFRMRQGLTPVKAKQELSQAANFLYILRGTEPTPEEVKALDVSMILYAEHEFNASTFAARVICSTLSDLHSGIVGAIGALKGPLHGGANEKVMDVLREAGGPDTAEAWTLDALAQKQRIMGFGHRVYKSGDVRAGILKPYVEAAAKQADAMQWEETASVIEKVMEREKGMYPNVDWPAGRLYHAMALEIPIYTPMFAMSRIVGWSAHIIEQLENNRLIRPSGRYIGVEQRDVVAIEER